MNIKELNTCFLFNGMKEKQIELALKKLNGTEKKYKKNSYIINKGQENIKLGLLLEGSATISQSDIWGNSFFINTINNGQTFAEPYAAIDFPSNIIVQATKPCKVLWLNISKINFAGNDPILLLITSNLLQDMAFKLLYLNEKIFQISKKTTQEKLLSYLSTKAQEKKSMDFVIPFNRQQLADYLCVERSAMSAEISKLKNQGKLKTRKNHFILSS